LKALGNFLLVGMNKKRTGIKNVETSIDFFKTIVYYGDKEYEMLQEELTMTLFVDFCGSLLLVFLKILLALFRFMYGMIFVMFVAFCRFTYNILFGK